jgi:hypothetical protein
MKYTVEMGSAAMIYVPSFIKIGSAIQKSIGVYAKNEIIIKLCLSANAAGCNPRELKGPIYDQSCCATLHVQHD